MTREELPSMHTARLQPAEVEALERDIRVLGEILSVTAKHGPAVMVPQAQELSLSVGVRQLLAGEVRGLQLHYRFEGRLWCDTLLADGGEGIRLVRMEQLP